MSCNTTCSLFIDSRMCDGLFYAKIWREADGDLFYSEILFYIWAGSCFLTTSFVSIEIHFNRLRLFCSYLYSSWPSM